VGIEKMRKLLCFIKPRMRKIVSISSLSFLGVFFLFLG